MRGSYGSTQLRNSYGWLRDPYGPVTDIPDHRGTARSPSSASRQGAARFGPHPTRAPRRVAVMVCGCSAFILWRRAIPGRRRSRRFASSPGAEVVLRSRREQELMMKPHPRPPAVWSAGLREVSCQATAVAGDRLALPHGVGRTVFLPCHPRRRIPGEPGRTSKVFAHRGRDGHRRRGRGGSCGLDLR